MSADTAFEIGRLYVPIKAIADTLTAAQKDIFVRLPGLVGYYPMGIRNQSGHAVEHSGASANLLQTGTCATGYDGNAFAHVGNGTNFLYGTNLYQITGLEAWITPSLRGLTLGGWFMIDALPASQSGLVTRHGPVTDYGYGLQVLSSGVVFAQVSGNGSSYVQVDSAIQATGQWIFAAMRFIPSTEAAVFVNADKTVNTTAVSASLNIASQAFEIGRAQGNNSFITHAKARDVFICASALSDALIEEIRVTSTP